MKIIATVRTRNEEKNIARFCEAYQNIADKILVADGGSVDRTVEIAESWPRVEVRRFEPTIQVGGGITINPQGEHVNFLIKWAKEEGAEWIIFDDCDCVPNFILEWQAVDRFYIATMRGHPAIYTRRAYFWGDSKIFPRLHEQNTSIWAWRSTAAVHADTTDQLHLKMNLGELRIHAMHLEFPYCLLHYFMPSPEEAAAKIKWYRDSGIQPSCLNPIDWAGDLAPSEWFMRREPPK